MIVKKNKYIINAKYLLILLSYILLNLLNINNLQSNNINSSSMEFIDDGNLFHLKNISSFIEAKNSDEARDLSSKNAKKESFNILLDNLNINRESMKYISLNEISDLIYLVRVKKEKITNNSYFAYYDISFNKNAVNFLIKKYLNYQNLISNKENKYYILPVFNFKKSSSNKLADYINHVDNNLFYEIFNKHIEDSKYHHLKIFHLQDHINKLESKSNQLQENISEGQKYYQDMMKNINQNDNINYNSIANSNLDNIHYNEEIFKLILNNEITHFIIIFLHYDDIEKLFINDIKIFNKYDNINLSLTFYYDELLENNVIDSDFLTSNLMLEANEKNLSPIMDYIIKQNINFLDSKLFSNFSFLTNDKKNIELISTIMQISDFTDIKNKLKFIPEIESYNILKISKSNIKIKIIFNDSLSEEDIINIFRKYQIELVKDDKNNNLYHRINNYLDIY